MNIKGQGKCTGGDWIKRGGIFWIIVLLLGLLCKEEGVYAYNTDNHPLTEFSPDGEIFTIKEPLAEPLWVEFGKQIPTGITVSPVVPEKGQHIYKQGRGGLIPVQYWKCMWSRGRCIHGDHSVKNYHGLSYVTENCYSGYYSGYYPVCAVCGEYIRESLHYLSETTASQLEYYNVDLGYYYICPTNNSLEQAVQPRGHQCNAVSANRYVVTYDANCSDYYGGMSASSHMYNNETEFEGRQVTPVTRLTKNTFYRDGYEFGGWNTQADGRGLFFGDCQEIYNLTAENYDEATGRGRIVLYAQWIPCVSTLVIDGNGGKYETGDGYYNGAEEVTVFENQPYGRRLQLDAERKLVPPKGAVVSFVTGNGEMIFPIEAKRIFCGWAPSEPFNGSLVRDVYTFTGANGTRDMLTANYYIEAIVLPAPTSPEFSGWYEDEERTKPVGVGGDLYTPKEDITLYGAFHDTLALSSVTDLTVDGGRGGVDLSWVHKKPQNKSYKIFQKLWHEDTWITVDERGIVPEKESTTYDYRGISQSYEVKYTGIYTLEAFGAQGAQCVSEEMVYPGGKGGAVSARIWLRAGDRLTVAVGGMDGYNGGGAGDEYGNGGGMTSIISEELGVLLIAGGGGGASASAAGGDGGLSTHLRSDGGGEGVSASAGGGGGYVGGGEKLGEGNESQGVANVATEYNYGTGTQIYKAPVDGIYQMEVWGGRGYHCTYGHATAAGGAGGYAAAQISLDKGTVLYLVTGGYGDTGYNGGGSGDGHQGGGGATHIALRNRGVLKNYEAYRSEVLLVAGGGGSAGCIVSGDFNNEADIKLGGLGGGVSGGSGGDSHSGRGGSQNGGGLCGNDWWEAERYAGFGQGASGDTGGGGGWYGGGSGHCFRDYEKDEEYDGGAGGGSGYINTARVIAGSGNMISGGNPATHGKARITLVKKTGFAGGGGSNYVYEGAVFSTSEVGRREGNGYAVISMDKVGFVTDTELDNVAAPDMEPPSEIDLEKVITAATDTEEVIITWEAPEDKGTAYHHLVTAYIWGSDGVNCHSNITFNRIITGIEKYYYIYGNEKELTVTKDNLQGIVGKTEGERLCLPISPGEKKYLYLAPVDGAGNVGPTTRVEIDPEKFIWNIMTEQMEIGSWVGNREYGSVSKKGDKTYYVKADGSTLFQLCFASFMDGRARENYQINYQIFDIGALDTEGQRYVTELPRRTVAEGQKAVIEAKDCVRSAMGSDILKDGMYTVAICSDELGKVLFSQAFSVSPRYNGRHLTVIPGAGASYVDGDGHIGVQYSEGTRDSSHGLTLIPDGEAPMVTGMEELEYLDIIDRRAGNVELYVTAFDALSGLKDFYLEIYNRDNHIKRKILPGADGGIRLTLTEDIPMFSGDFTVSVYATDCVGNEYVRHYSTTEFALEASVERILEPHDTAFKCGESGILTIETWGYAERVEVEFPSEMSLPGECRNYVFEYGENADYFVREELEFMIPLDAPKGREYVITVRAYKGDGLLEEYPFISTVEVQGSVLEDVRTRLR